ncbi:chromate transporter [Lysinibacillus composti]|nr:chromate transporter [Lysinibacillus composti]
MIEKPMDKEKRKGIKAEEMDQVKDAKMRDIFMAFFRIGMLGFGGGPSAIPLVEKEVVGRFKWMTLEDFGDTIALANTMPGPIATKLAGYIGYRVGGIMGCLSAMIASVIPTVILMIMMLTVLQTYKDIPWVQSMSNAVVPVVAVMLAVLTWSFIKQSKDSMGWLKAILLIVASIILLEVLGLHPGILIAVLIAAVFVPFKKKGGE